MVMLNWMVMPANALSRIAVILAVIVGCGVLSSWSEELPYQMKRVEVSYLLEDFPVEDSIRYENDISFPVYEIKNTADCNLWILLERDSEMTNKDLIYYRFKRPLVPGGTPTFQWLIEDEVNWGKGTVSLFQTFFKILPPGRSFYIVFGADVDVEEYLDALRVIPNSEMETLFKSLSKIPAGRMPSYQADVIVIGSISCDRRPDTGR